MQLIIAEVPVTGRSGPVILAYELLRCSLWQEAPSSWYRAHHSSSTYIYGKGAATVVQLLPQRFACHLCTTSILAWPGSGY